MIAISPSSVHDITRKTLATHEGLINFGKSLIRCCLYNKELFDLANICVNFDQHTGKYDRSDFLDTADGLLFASSQEFARCWFPANPWPQDWLQWAQAITPHLDLFFTDNPSFPASYKTEVIGRLMRLGQPMTGEFDLVCDGLVDYVTGVRYYQLELSIKGADPVRKRAAYAAVPLSLRIPGETATVKSSNDILAAIFSAPAPTKPFYTGIGAFDHHYASRSQGGDAWLGFSGTGGGKTNFSCQASGFTALHGKKVMYVTTEVKTPTLYMRMFCATTKTPYGVLKGIIGCGGAHPNAAAFAEWTVNGPGQNITIFDYRDVAGADYKEKYARMLDAYHKAKGGYPDLIIWDWIGKALDSGFSDAWQKREAYNGVAAMMNKSADELDNVTIVLAQANKESKNKTNLSESDTADSKSLADGMEGCLAFTSLMDLSEGNGGEQEAHKENQYLIIPKCREELTYRLPVRRAFEYCRFESQG